MFYKSEDLLLNTENHIEESDVNLTDSVNMNNNLPVIDIQNVMNALSSSNHLDSSQIGSDSFSINNMLGGDKNDTDSIIDLSSILNGLSISDSTEEQTGGRKKRTRRSRRKRSSSRRRKRSSSSRRSRRKRSSRRRRRRRSSRHSSSS